MSEHFTILHLRVEAPATLRLMYADERIFYLDMLPIIDATDSLDRLLEPDVIASAKIVNRGASVRWAEDKKLTLSADFLRAWALEQDCEIEDEDEDAKIEEEGGTDTDKETLYERFFDAVRKGDLNGIRAAVAAGFDLNSKDKSGYPLLNDVVFELCDTEEPNACRYDVVRELLRLGADPTLTDPDGVLPLDAAARSMDAEMVRILVEAGSDPNWRCTDDPSAQIFYDVMETSYMYNVWDINKCGDPADEDVVCEEAWLSFLDRQAIALGKTRPEHLWMLRACGARTGFELHESPASKFHGFLNYSFNEDLDLPITIREGVIETRLTIKGEAIEPNLVVDMAALLKSITSSGYFRIFVAPYGRDESRLIKVSVRQSTMLSRWKPVGGGHDGKEFWLRRRQVEEALQRYFAELKKLRAENPDSLRWPIPGQTADDVWDYFINPAHNPARASDSPPPSPAKKLRRQTEKSRDAVVRMAYSGDIEGVRTAVAVGFDLNGFVHKDDDTLLDEIVADLAGNEDKPWRYELIRELLRLGADAKQVNSEGYGPLFSAAMNMDTEMVRILLNAGANPNPYHTDDSYESLLDWLEFDYRLDIWDLNGYDNSAEDDLISEDTWLAFLDRQAIAHGKRRPDHLILLRDYGAKTTEELSETPGSAIYGIRNGSYDELELRLTMTGGSAETQVVVNGVAVEPRYRVNVPALLKSMTQTGCFRLFIAPEDEKQSRVVKISRREGGLLLLWQLPLNSCGREVFWFRRKQMEAALEDYFARLRQAGAEIPLPDPTEPLALTEEEWFDSFCSGYREPANAGGDHGELTEMEAARAWATAYNSRDIAPLVPLLADDFHYHARCFTSRNIESKREYLSWLANKLDAIRYSGTQTWAELCLWLKRSPCVVISTEDDKEKVMMFQFRIKSGRITGFDSMGATNEKEYERTGDYPGRP